MEKMYFNLTRILNGWTLKYAPFISNDERCYSVVAGERFFRRLKDAHEFMTRHTKKIQEISPFDTQELFKVEDVME